MHDGEQKTRRIRLGLILYALICLFSISFFWIFDQKGDALGFSLIHFYGLHPIAIVLISVFLGKGMALGRWIGLTASLFGCGFMLTDYLTFRLTNMISFSTWRCPEFSIIAAGVILSLLGLLAGAALRTITKKH